MRPTNSVFPRAQSGTVLDLTLGNMTLFRVGIIWTEGGLHVSVEGRGAYTFMVRADAGYVQSKLCVLPGDATNLADFINDQLFVPGSVKRQGSYYGKYAHVH